MTFAVFVTLVILVGILVGLVREKHGPEIIMLAGLTALMLFGVVGVGDALSGFSSPSVVALGALFVIGAGLRSTGALAYIGLKVFGRPRPGGALYRLTAPVCGLSAFFNNMPLVAIFVPVFVDRAKRLRISPSKLLIPLSYASMLGGTCTLIGTSTNLVVDEVLQNSGQRGLGMFELTWVGLPLSIAGLVYLSTAGQRLLPERTDLLEHIGANLREYSVEMLVARDCELAGKTVRDSGLRDLPGLYLYRIERFSHVISPVAPEERIFAGDLLHFSGVISTVVDLQKIRGLEPVDADGSSHPKHSNAQRIHESLDSLEGVPTPDPPRPAPRIGPQLCEAVVAPTSPLVGQTIRDSQFRARYQASIVAVHRSGTALQQKIGQIVLSPGDTLLLDAGPDFVSKWRNSSDFVLVSGVDDSAPVDYERSWLALGIFGLTVLGITFGNAGIAIPALVGAGLMIFTKCVASRDVIRTIELPVLILIAATLGVGSALDSSGVSELINKMLISLGGANSPFLLLAVFIFATSIMSQFLSNVATAALMGQLAITTADQFQFDPRGLVIGVAIAASTAFATPIGYQTNLMVRGPGGYRFMDYVRVGAPLSVLCCLVSLVVIYFVWPL
ncbi:Citrate transporter [Planctomycetes bacterium Pan216]|uniref:Citrate transporter n=1 Tax=Kolteria novifilia TaxID=2527975 RepID=A0A518BBM2_9BACT|nr:Citrate transporter [Planctomycetes bacterium Pan216]